ncbi:unnamed protein product, partial [marine sediment metagenome]
KSKPIYWGLSENSYLSLLNSLIRYLFASSSVFLDIKILKYNIEVVSKIYFAGLGSK